MRKILLTLCLAPCVLWAQEDLLAGTDSTEAKPVVESAFKALKIVNLESTKLAAKKDFYLIIAHRFASVKSDFEGFYGLDDAVTQIKFLYGLTSWLTVAGARSEQAYDASAKYSLQPQIKGGFPFAVTGFSSIAFNNLLKEHNYPKMTFSDRIIYVQQLLISRKFNDKLSLEVAPTFFHENFTLVDDQDNSQYAIGVGGRYKIGKRWSVNADYAAHLNRAADSPFRNPLSIGVDLETGGHVFQMHFTSSQGIHEAGFLGNSTGNWAKGDIFFGFNLLRVF
jgi:hypothetical protein